MSKFLFRVGVFLASFFGFFLLIVVFGAFNGNFNKDTPPVNLVSFTVSILFLAGVYLLNTNKPEKD